MRSSFILFELVVATILASALLILSSFIYKNIVSQNNLSEELAITHLKINTLKVFLETNKDSLNQLRYENNNLYFQNEPLFYNLSNFTIENSSDFYKIVVKIDSLDNFVWYIKR